MAKFTKEQAQKAREMIDLGVPWTRVAKRFEVSVATLKYHLDPQFKARMLEYANSHARLLRVRPGDFERVKTEAGRRGVPMADLIHELVEQGIPGSVPEAAE